MPAFVGRVGELVDLRGFVARAVAGRGGLALVVGAPGVGKTTLVEHAVDGVDAAVVWARAREEGGTPPLWLWEQVIRAWGDGSDPAASTSWARVSAATMAGSGHERFRVFDEWTRRVATLARVRPVVIVLDDLQWADPESLALLEFLGPDLAGMCVGVLATARADEMHTVPRADLVVELDGLSRKELYQLLEHLVGAPPDDALLTAVEQHTGANPFFVGEVARLLSASHRVDDPAHWHGTVPQGVRSVLERRLARLPQHAHDALGVAAVVGFEVDPDVLASVLGTDRVDALDRVDPAVRNGMLRDLGDGRVAFAHALVHNAVLGSLAVARRCELHGAAASALHGLYGARAAAPIAEHLLAAGDLEQAVPWVRVAGDAAFDASMYADAARWYGRALQAGHDPPPMLLVRHADALSRCGRVEEANAQYRSAAAAARDASDADTLARAALGIGTVGGGFEVRLLEPAQRSLLQSALAALPVADSPVRAMLAARMSVALTLEADHATRVALADEAVAMARRLGDDGALAYALSAWCDAHAGPAQLVSRTDAAREMLAVARRSGDPELELLAHRFLIVAAMERADVAGATREIAAFARIADTLRQPQFCWYARLEEGMLALLHGDLDGAQRLGEEAVRLGRAAGSGNAQMLAKGGLLMAVARERGDESFKQMLLDANAPFPEADRGLDLLPLICLGRGADDAAVRRSLRQLDDEAIGPDDGLYILYLALRGDGAAHVRDRATMDHVAALLEPYADRMVLDGTAAVCYGPVATTLARIAAARGDLDGAQAWYDRARAILRAADAPLLLDAIDREVASLGPRATSPAPGSVEDSTPAQLRREGDVWFVAFAGASARVRHVKGIADLALLLARPGVEVHVLDLVAAGEGRAAGEVAADRDLGPVIDATARAAYERRIRDLTEQIEDAVSRHDDITAARLDAERSHLVRMVAAALGIAGRSRPHGSDVERARKAVGMRVRDAVTRLEQVLPELGRHLRHSIRTGTYCAYIPEHPTTWNCSW
jgi:hypothetical protein